MTTSETEDPPRNRIAEAIRDARVGTTLGLFLVFVGQLQFESWSNRAWLDRWSHFAFASIVAVGLLATIAAVTSARRLVRGAATGARPGAAARSFDLGVFVWGVSFLWAALAEPEAGGRLLDLNVFGALHPGAALLEWVALAAFAWAGLLVLWTRYGASHRQAVMLAVLLVGSLLLAEGALRLWIVAAPRTQGFPTASTELWMRRYVERNAEGFRDRARDEARTPGARRVVVIGDSFAFGQGVDRPEDRVSDRLEVSLSRSPLGDTEVLNMARCYTHTLQHMDFLERALAYRPDAILLLYVFNDIYYLQSGARPTAVTGASGSLLARLHPARVAFENSYLYQQAYLRFRHLYWRFAPPAAKPEDPYDDPELLGRHLEDLRAFVERAAQDGVPTRIVPFVPRYALETDREHFRGIVRAMLDAGLPVWPVEDAYGDTPYASLIVNQMDHHPNETSNALLAAAIEPLLVSLLQSEGAARAPAAKGAGAGLE